MTRLTIVFEDALGTVARDKDNQLYLGQYDIVLEGDSPPMRRFEKIQEYSISYNGEPRLTSYVLDDGSVVGPIASLVREFKPLDEEEDLLVL